MSPRHPPAKLIVFCVLTFAAAVALLCLAGTEGWTRYDDVTLLVVGTSSYVPTQLLFATRVTSLALIVLSLVVYFCDEKADMSPPLWEGSRLEGATLRCSTCPQVGLCAFTLQCWLLQLLYFAGASACSLAVMVGWHNVSTAATAFLWLAFEASFSCAILVTVAVSFVLIPENAKQGNAEGVANFFTWSTLMMHNANLAFMATELVLSRLTLQITHFPVVVLWGLYYVLIAWGLLRFTGVILYPFLDPTIPRAVVCHVALIVALLVFFLIGSAVAATAALMPLGLRVALVSLASVAIMRTRWIRGVPELNKGRPSFTRQLSSGLPGSGRISARLSAGELL